MGVIRDPTYPFNDTNIDEDVWRAERAAAQASAGSTWGVREGPGTRA